MIPTTRRFRSLRAALNARRAEVHDDAGFATVEALGMAAISIVVIVAVGGLLQTLGVDVIDKIRTAIGL